MISFICLFFPAIIGVKIFHIFKKGKYDLKELFICYGSIVTISNIITMTIFFYTLSVRNNILDVLNQYPGTAVKYLVLSSIIACVVSLLIEIVDKNLEMKVIIKNEKNK